MLIIGSHALRIYDSSRSVKDIDIIGTRREIEKFIEKLDGSHTIEYKEHAALVRRDKKLIYELFYAENNNSFESYLMLEDAHDTYELKIAGLATLFSIKKSHIYFPTNLPKFEKHLKDYLLLLSMVGKDNLLGYTAKHQKFNEKIRGKRLRTPKLNKDSYKFFKESSGPVQYTFIHDELHDVMSHGDKPRYTLMQKENSTSAFCYESLWNEMSNQHKLEAVLEEAYVIALERHLIPKMYNENFETSFGNPMLAFKWALMRICTNLCSGFFREFAQLNYFHLVNTFNINYAKKFEEALAEGRIKPAKGKLVKS